jgi:hypothetical protein
MSVRSGGRFLASRVRGFPCPLAVESRRRLPHFPVKELSLDSPPPPRPDRSGLRADCNRAGGVAARFLPWRTPRTTLPSTSGGLGRGVPTVAVGTGSSGLLLSARPPWTTTFWARSRDKGGGNPSEPYTLTGVEFTRRWALHILPKGFVKSRCFGGFSCRQRKAYLARCRTLVGSPAALAPPPPEASADEPAQAEPFAPLCPRCQTPMKCVFQDERVGWRSVVNGPHGPAWYRSLRHAVTWGSLDEDWEPPDG